MTLHYPSRMGHILLDAMEEVMGRNALQDILIRVGLEPLAGARASGNTDLHLSPESIRDLNHALAQTYGPRAGRGLAQRIGRACFKYGLRVYGETLGLTRTDFRTLPFRAKLRTAGQALASLLNEQASQNVQIAEADGKLLWRVEQCPLCSGRRESEPICNLTVGLLQESLYWLSSGKIFRVEETQCIARGDAACLIEIHTTPLD